MVHRRPVYIYSLNVPIFSNRYFNKIKRTSRLGRLLALSLEILSILCLLVPSASYLCKQFGPRSEPTKFQTLSVLKKLDTLVVFFKKCKITQATKIKKK